jgi:hypothetical protein
MKQALVVVAFIAVAVSGCDSPKRSATTRADQLSKLAQTRLADAYYTAPFNCQDPWLASDSNVILTLESWAEDAGVRRGDRLVRIGDRDLTGDVSWDDAMRLLPKGQSFTIATNRRGQQQSFVLDCHDHGPYLNAERGAFEAMRDRQWAKCIQAAELAMQVFGSKTTPMLDAQMECFEQLDPDPKAEGLASLMYQAGITGIEEMKFDVPAERTALRARVVDLTGKLQQAGFVAFAADLQHQLYMADPTDDREVTSAVR